PNRAQVMEAYAGLACLWWVDRPGRNRPHGPEVLRPLLHRFRQVTGPQAGDLTDAELLERFVRQRDAAAFELLLWRHGAMVLGVCRRVLRHEQDAEDAFQATFLALARMGGSIGRREACAAWLHRVACHVALNARAARA